MLLAVIISWILIGCIIMILYLGLDLYDFYSDCKKHGWFNK